MIDESKYFAIGKEFDRLVGDTYGGGQKTWKRYDQIALRCVKCTDYQELKCDNCGNEEWEFAAIGAGERVGIACRRCNTGFADWKCWCGTSNPVNGHTLYLKKAGGCFVATAAFGDYASPEVIYLSSFRDELLSRTSLGRETIRIYYKLGPYLAAAIQTSSFRRKIIRRAFLRPLIKILRLVFEPLH